MLKGSNVSISEDYDKNTMDTRKKLAPLVQNLKQKGYEARLRDADIWIGSRKISKDEAIQLKKRPRETPEPHISPKNRNSTDSQNSRTQTDRESSPSSKKQKETVQDSIPPEGLTTNKFFRPSILQAFAYHK